MYKTSSYATWLKGANGSAEEWDPDGLPWFFDHSCGHLGGQIKEFVGLVVHHRTKEITAKLNAQFAKERKQWAEGSSSLSTSRGLGGGAENVQAKAMQQEEGGTARRKTARGGGEATAQELVAATNRIEELEKELGDTMENLSSANQRCIEERESMEEEKAKVGSVPVEAGVLLLEPHTTPTTPLQQRPISCSCSLGAPAGHRSPGRSAGRTGIHLPAGVPGIRLPCSCALGTDVDHMKILDFLHSIIFSSRSSLHSDTPAGIWIP